MHPPSTDHAPSSRREAVRNCSSSAYRASASPPMSSSRDWASHAARNVTCSGPRSHAPRAQAHLVASHHALARLSHTQNEAHGLSGSVAVHTHTVDRRQCVDGPTACPCRLRRPIGRRGDTRAAGQLGTVNTCRGVPTRAAAGRGRHAPAPAAVISSRITSRTAAATAWDGVIAAVASPRRATRKDTSSAARQPFRRARHESNSCAANKRYKSQAPVHVAHRGARAPSAPWRPASRGALPCSGPGAAAPWSQQLGWPLVAPGANSAAKGLKVLAEEGPSKQCPALRQSRASLEALWGSATPQGRPGARSMAPQ